MPRATTVECRGLRRMPFGLDETPGRCLKDLATAPLGIRHAHAPDIKKKHARPSRQRRSHSACGPAAPARARRIAKATMRLTETAMSYSCLAVLSPKALSIKVTSTCSTGRSMCSPIMSTRRCSAAHCGRHCGGRRPTIRGEQDQRGKPPTSR